MIHIETINLGPMGNCTYLITQGADALLIDPAWDPDYLINLIQTRKLHLHGVFFTHGHFDHVKFADRLLSHFNLKGYLEEKDIELAGLPSQLLHLYAGNQQIKIGPFDVRITPTPGHTAGCVCIGVGDALFTGDTLFVGACGRVDLPSSDPRQMRESLRLLASLPENTRIFSGHDYGGRNSSTIGEEKKNNPFMRNALRGEIF